MRTLTASKTIHVIGWLHQSNRDRFRATIFCGLSPRLTEIFGHCYIMSIADEFILKVVEPSSDLLMWIRVPKRMTRRAESTLLVVSFRKIGSDIVRSARINGLKMSCITIDPRFIIGNSALLSKSVSRFHCRSTRFDL